MSRANLEFICYYCKTRVELSLVLNAIAKFCSRIIVRTDTSIMGFTPIIYRGKSLTVHKAIVNPDFNSKTILVTSTWEYVEMWLKRNHKDDTLFYWQQAKHFFDASEKLPKISSPLTTYYCFLNAIKSLLIVKGISFTDRHGVSGKTVTKSVSLSDEEVTFEASGILFALCQYLNEPANNQTYTLKQLLYNLPYIHRAYSLTFESDQEIFIPILEPRFVQKDDSSESWFCTDITDQRYTNSNTLSKLPAGFEQDCGVNDKFVIRRKNRFRWQNGQQHEADNIQQLTNYYHNVRKQLYYIYSSSRLWYIKCSGNINGLIDRSSLTITFAAMHKLSELARYSPITLAKHFDSEHNWLLSEFINTALYQFIDEISSEITGQEFMIPGVRL